MMSFTKADLITALAEREHRSHARLMSLVAELRATNPLDSERTARLAEAIASEEGARSATEEAIALAMRLLE